MVCNLLGVLALFSGLAHEPIAHAWEGEIIHLEGQLGVDHGSAILANNLVIQQGLQLLVHRKNLSVWGKSISAKHHTTGDSPAIQQGLLK